MQDKNKQPILAHLNEVRIRLTKSLIAVILSLIISFPVARYIYPVLMKPVSDIQLYYYQVTGLFSSNGAR